MSNENKEIRFRIMDEGLCHDKGFETVEGAQEMIKKIIRLRIAQNVLEVQKHAVALEEAEAELKECRKGFAVESYDLEQDKKDFPDYYEMLAENVAADAALAEEAKKS